MSMQLPGDFCEQMEKLLGTEAYGRFLAALQAEQPVSLRLNPWKSFPFAGTSGEQMEAAAPVQPVPWCAGGYYLSSRPTFTFDPLFHAGVYYVQEASSMFLQQVISQHVTSAVRALDLCAAPGGKSTLLRSMLPEGSMLVANEVMRTRAQVLAENMAKWGHPDVVVTNNDPSDFTRPFENAFQLIVVDAPCSGEGMFRKDEGAIAEWSPALVALCVERQQRILADIWPCLQPGGILVYSTCTFNRQEDEDNLQWMVDTFGAEPLPVCHDARWGVTGDLTGRNLPVYRFMPHHVRGEGFFLCAVRKPGEADAVGFSPKKNKRPQKAVPVPDVLKQWVRNAGDFDFKLDKNGWSAIPKRWEPFYAQVQSHLSVLHAGVPLAEPKGKDLLPRHGLSMSSACCSDAFAQVEVSYEMALAYLRKEALVLPADTPRGFVLLTYKGVPLGFAKNLGNRANNLYPAEWRIRSSHLPDELKFVF